METPFKQISLSDDDVLSRDVMQTIGANNQWLLENTPRGRFYFDTGGGRSKGQQLVIISGRVKIGKNKKSRYGGGKVSFGKNLFADTCKPIVSLGIIANDNDIYAVANGLGKDWLPSNNGFEIRVFVATGEDKKWKISKEFWVCWQAVGYKNNV